MRENSRWYIMITLRQDIYHCIVAELFHLVSPGRESGDFAVVPASVMNFGKIYVLPCAIFTELWLIYL